MPLRVPNAVDTHCHFSPDTSGRPHKPGDGESGSALRAAREAAASGHAAVVLKSHSFASPQLAQNLQEVVPDVRIFGGICTDDMSGGLNVTAVEAALRLGAKIVWLPTVNSHEDYLNRPDIRDTFKGEGIKVVDDDGEVLPEVREIFDLVRHHDAVLATGHTAAAEHHAVAKAFGTSGQVLVTHAGEKLAGPRLGPSQCSELADLGATIELTALSCKDAKGLPGKSPEEMASTIRTIGPARCTLATDYGWSDAFPRPAAGMGEFLEALWHAGITDDELRTMASTNPARLLRLDLT